MGTGMSVGVGMAWVGVWVWEGKERTEIWVGAEGMSARYEDRMGMRVWARVGWAFGTGTTVRWY